MNVLFNKDENMDILYEKVIGSRNSSNLFWTIIILFASLGFLIVGISSYLKYNLIEFFNSDSILFFPQGLVMSIYGVLGIIISSYQWFTIFLKIGEGYNKIDTKKRQFEIFRWGFPGKNREINLKYPFDDIDLIKVEIVEGINPKRTIYLKLKNKSEIPLNSSQRFLSINELEKKTTQLAEILQVSIEGL
uniref:Photosystem I assembly protein Ycf4 n=1 Tax=Eutreptia viridis TaxID=96908 RepID=H8ZXG4_9EUGL|nr:photosystem I assembly protein ycf4 [Eutreptia viridis]